MNDPVTLLYLVIAIVAIAFDIFSDNDLNLPPPRRMLSIRA